MTVVRGDKRGTPPAAEDKNTQQKTPRITEDSTRTTYWPTAWGVKATLACWTRCNFAATVCWTCQLSCSCTMWRSHQPQHQKRYNTPTGEMANAGQTKLNETYPYTDQNQRQPDQNPIKPNQTPMKPNRIRSNPLKPQTKTQSKTNQHPIKTQSKPNQAGYTTHKLIPTRPYWNTYYYNIHMRTGEWYSR